MRALVRPPFNLSTFYKAGSLAAFDLAAVHFPPDPHVGRETGGFFYPDRLASGNHEGSVAGRVVDVRAHIHGERLKGCCFH